MNSIPILDFEQRKKNSIAIPCWQYTVSAELHNSSTTILEDSILNAADACGGDLQKVADSLCLSFELVKFIADILVNKGDLDSNYLRITNNSIKKK